MKNFRFFLPIVIALVSVVLFTQCKKEEGLPCKLHITCVFDSLVVDNAVPFAIITFDTNNFHNGIVDTLISRYNVDTTIVKDWQNDTLLYEWCKEGCIDTTGKPYIGMTNPKFEFEHALPNPARLIVNAVKVSAVRDSLDNIIDYVRYEGTIQVSVEPNETTKKTIRMVVN